jgi:hypothetical protein
MVISHANHQTTPNPIYQRIGLEAVRYHMLAQGTNKLQAAALHVSCERIIEVSLT